MLILFLLCELSRTSGYIDIPTAPQYDIPGMLGGGLSFSATLITDDPDPYDDQRPDPADFDLFFKYGFSRGELSLSAFHINTYVLSVSYLLAKEEENIPAFFIGVDDITYNTHVSTRGIRDTIGFIEEYNYATHCGGRPWELFSTYIGMQKSLGKHLEIIMGLGRGRFVGYGDRSHYFNTDLFVLGDRYKSPEHSWWAFGLFFGGALKVPGGLEMVAEMDGRDGNIGFKYHHQYFTATLGLAKAEQLPWWNHPPFSPRLVIGLETSNKAMLEAPRVGSIECVVQDFTTKEILTNAIIDLKEVNKRYRAPTGIFSLSLPAGNYTITASRSNYADYIAQITVKPGVKTKLIFNLKKTEEQLRREQQLKSINNYLAQGKAYFTEGNLKLALDAFNNALSIDPNNKEAREYLAQIEAKKTEFIANYSTEARAREKSKDYSGALQLWQKILELDPENTEAKTAIASLEKKITPEKKPQGEAKKPAEEKATPEQIEALYKKGVSYFAAEKYEEALKVFKQVLALDPQHKGAKEYKKRTEARIKALKGG
uniref:Tetratricopeptide repeat protein n=1 Tax=candidate division WOR-3 bacterium TaxID=2052148 RepID=A0A7C4XFS8_UNCW3